MHAEGTWRVVSARSGLRLALSRQDLEGLYRQFAPSVRRRAVSLLRDEQEALDVTQETFLAYVKMAETLRGDARPFTVLYQIATFQALDRLRRRARWNAILRPDQMPETDDADSPLPQPATVVDDSKRVEAAQDLAILTYGEDHQTMTAACLYHVEGCTTEEIAEMLDLSRKTVGRLLAQFSERARKRAARLAPGDFS
jgi:RNA polymerase sigma factor (sigma-70 family)